MRLAIITHQLSPGSGQGRVNYEVARAIADRGHDVILLASSVSDELASHPSVTWIPILVEGWPTRLMKDQVFAWKSARWLHAHEEAFDIALANGCITWASTAANAIHFVHSAWLQSPVHTARVRSGPYAWYQYLYSAVNAWWERKTLSETPHIIAVSHQVRQELIDIGIDPPSIHVIHNGVDTEEFKPGPADRAALGLPTEVPLALFVGDIQTPRKNLDSVLHALDAISELHLAVVGSTEGSVYPRMAATLGLSDRAHFLGFRNDVPDLMRAADLFVFPSRYEACSLVLLEALASGLPVITARTAGGAELITESSGRVLPDPNNVSALEDAIQSLVQHPDRLRRMSRSARALAEKHTWSIMAKQYLDLLRRITLQPQTLTK